MRLLRGGELLAGAACTVGVSSTGEGGLLGIALHPSFLQNGWFYLYYTDAGGNNKVTRFTWNGGSCIGGVDILPSLVGGPSLLRNGGGMAFGPDGKLYVGVGDGGAGGDPYDTGQNPNDMLGCLLRIDVSGASGWSVPAGNPIGGNPVWCWGLRNPWRFSFDRGTGRLRRLGTANTAPGFGTANTPTCRSRAARNDSRDFTRITRI